MDDPDIRLRRSVWIWKNKLVFDNPMIINAMFIATGDVGYIWNTSRSHNSVVVNIYHEIFIYPTFWL
jgi:hypothetical protein